jgi:hypothetical protein
MIKVAWDSVTRDHVSRAIGEYDRLGPEQSFAQHGFGPTTTYDPVSDKRGFLPRSPSTHTTANPSTRNTAVNATTFIATRA